jgi:hypothetical protein
MARLSLALCLLAVLVGVGEFFEFLKNLDFFVFLNRNF